MRKVDSSDIDRIRSKWEPVISSRTSFKNKNIINLICLYSEWYSNDDSGVCIMDLPERLLDIFQKIESHSRIEILGKFANVVSGNIEYKLSNGKFVPINGITEYEISEEDKVEIFGQEFIKDLDRWKYYITDKQKFRDRNLDNILE